MDGNRLPVTRLFVCVEPSAEAIADLGTVVDGLEIARADAPGHSTRLAARDRWHLTLAFLGDVSDNRMDRSKAALDVAAAAMAGHPVTIRFAGGGTFGRGDFTILWAGLGGDVAALRDLASVVRGQLRRRRVQFDRKAFRPHLTIARPGVRVPPDPLARDVETLSGYEGPEWTVDAVRLVASQLGPRPVYTTVHTAELPISRTRR